MTSYAFVIAAPPPRFEYRTETEETAEVSPRPVRAIEQAVANVLVNFPEAYRAVLDEARRLIGLPRSP